MFVYSYIICSSIIYYYCTFIYNILCVRLFTRIFRPFVLRIERRNSKKKKKLFLPQQLHSVFIVEITGCSHLRRRGVDTKYLVTYKNACESCATEFNNNKCGTGSPPLQAVFGSEEQHVVNTYIITRCVYERAMGPVVFVAKLNGGLQ